MQIISHTYQHRFRLKLGLQVCLLASIACQGVFGQQFMSPPYRKEAPDKVVKGIYNGRELEFKSWSGPQKLLSLEKANLGKATLFGGADRSGVPYSGPSAKKQTVYVNRTFTTNSPHINAEVVVNESTFEAVSPLDMPYYFYNTKYFTNNGTFKAYDDLDFRNYQTFENLLGEWDYEPVNAKVFVNNGDGVIERAAPSLVSGRINIGADKIINRGLITSDTAGIFELKGKEVDLSGGGLEIRSASTYDYYNDPDGNGLFWGAWGDYQGRRAYRAVGNGGGGVYFPDFGVSDVYWDIVSPGTVIGAYPAYADVSGDYAFINSIRHYATEVRSAYPIIGQYTKPLGGHVIYQFPSGWDGWNQHNEAAFTPYVTEYRTIAGDTWHHSIQGVMVRNRGDANIEFDTKFWPLIVTWDPSWDPEQWYINPIVEFKTKQGLTNVVTGGEQINSIYLIDELANNETQWNWYMTNIITVPNTQIATPDNYVVTRYQPAEFQNALSPNSSLEPWTYFYGSAFPTTYYQSVYGVRVTNIMSRADLDIFGFGSRPPVSGVGADTNYNPTPNLYNAITNIQMGLSERPVPDVEGANKLDQPGRIKIFADSLDLTSARIRAEGGVVLKANHLVGSSNAIIDCQNLSIDLGSTNGLLVITNIVQSHVERMTGHIEAYSSAWLNQYTMQIRNAEGELADQSVTVHYSLLAVDAILNSTNEVLVNDLTLRSERVLLEDPIKVTELLFLDGVNDLEVNNYMRLGTGGKTGQSNWDRTVAPDLMNMTINGTLEIPETAHFGDDRETPYNSWLNYGNYSSFTLDVKANRFQNSGYIYVNEAMNIKARNTILEYGQSFSRTLMKFSGENAKLFYATNTSHGPFTFDYSDTLTDGGEGSRNHIEVWNDLTLARKPALGDLLGTTILVNSTNYTDRIVHWMAEDRGASADGFKDNTAVGHFILQKEILGQISFRGGEGSLNAIYVDYLDLKGLSEADLYKGDVLKKRLDNINISENFHVYFASSSLPEQKLDGMYEGRLRWVKEFPGPNSSMPFYMLGLDKTIQVNRAFRQSTLDDTDGDGTANGFDLTPFGGGLPDITGIAVQEMGFGQINITWMGVPGSIYHVEYKNDLGEPEWKLLKKYPYEGPDVRKVTYEDRLGRASLKRFYRVVLVE